MLDTIKFQCYYCREQLTDATRTRDHIWPKSKGGKLYKKNKVYACRSCNRYKRDLTIEEWLNVLLILKQTKKTKKIWAKKETIIVILRSLIEYLKYNTNENTVKTSRRVP